MNSTEFSRFFEEHFCNRVKSAAQLRHAILSHTDRFAQMAADNYYKKVNPTPITQIEIVLGWTDCIPYSTKKSVSEPETMTWQPGWIGHLGYTVLTTESQISELVGGACMWDGSRIHIYSGGHEGSTRTDNNLFHQTYSYCVCLSEKNWPAMADSYRRVRIIDKICGSNSVNLTTEVNNSFPPELY